jgi:hypothetical protein
VVVSVSKIIEKLFDLAVKILIIITLNERTLTTYKKLEADIYIYIISFRKMLNTASDALIKHINKKIQS